MDDAPRTMVAVKLNSGDEQNERLERQLREWAAEMPEEVTLFELPGLLDAMVPTRLAVCIDGVFGRQQSGPDLRKLSW